MEKLIASSSRKLVKMINASGSRFLIQRNYTRQNNTCRPSPEDRMVLNAADGQRERSPQGSISQTKAMEEECAKILKNIGCL